MRPRLAIIGVGFMGASLAAAARAAGCVSEIVGFDTDRESLEIARARGFIDREAATLADIDADLVVLATPVGTLPGLLATLAPGLRAGTVVSDMGSVKEPVAQAAQALGLRGFIPGHPFAGSERSGAAAARADLFTGRVVALTPMPGHDEAALARVRGLWEALGAHVRLLSPADHDRIAAYTSHLPHLLAFACAGLLADEARARDLYSFAGDGLRDFLRIAGSDPVMWRDICAANADVLGPVLAAYGERLAAYGEALAEGRPAALAEAFARARDFQETLKTRGPA